MNIKEAKEQIKNAMRAYFTKDEFGRYVIPIEKQRPIFLLGAPGIGKTAIMEQIAAELNVGLVPYSMTHHTRQSALGLPYIVNKVYGGKEYVVSEYTMSEIIASVYEMIEKSGKREGILFLDEINCVSETLAPSMLQFLQYKVFGNHRVPDGWIVVTAGNPPEYNNSVREFDIVTWDRLKRVDVEPNYDVWKEYAVNNNIHPAILGYLDINGEHFYKIETTVDGKRFVTARGWSDLSDMIRLYEQHGFSVKKSLVEQYLQNEEIARKFTQFYDLFIKYRSDYQIPGILEGKEDISIVERARKAKFDERVAFLELLFAAISERISAIGTETDSLGMILDSFKKFKMMTYGKAVDPILTFHKVIEDRKEELAAGKASSSLSADAQRVQLNAIKMLEEICDGFDRNKVKDASSLLLSAKPEYDRRLAELKKKATQAGKELSNAYAFLEKAFGEGQEILIFTTELTAADRCVDFISRFGCDAYYKHNKSLLLHERTGALMKQVNDLKWEDLD